MVREVTDASGALLRTLFVLRPALARFGWCHAALASAHFSAEAARRHHNWWQIPGASYPSLRAACEDYLVRLTALCPRAEQATAIEDFALALSAWPQLPPRDALVALYRATWPPYD